LTDDHGEIALLAQRGRFRFSLPTDVWLGQATTIPGLRVVALSLPIIATAARLVALKDPADMLIVATAQHHGARLVTSDRRIDESGLVGVVA
jgi:PIN domain nuclease of toxin-antitoxin system